MKPRTFLPDRGRTESGHRAPVAVHMFRGQRH